MKAEIKELWLKALRSGKYHQTDGQLREAGNNDKRVSKEADGFCCLGVLCDLHRRNADDGLDWNGEQYGEAGLTGFPPKRVYSWAGLHHETGKTLAQMNDNGLSFKKIADYIEKRL